MAITSTRGTAPPNSIVCSFSKEEKTFHHSTDLNASLCKNANLRLIADSPLSPALPETRVGIFPTFGGTAAATSPSVIRLLIFFAVIIFSLGLGLILPLPADPWSPTPSVIQPKSGAQRAVARSEAPHTAPESAPSAHEPEEKKR
jgi:hypothetical protein